MRRLESLGHRWVVTEESESLRNRWTCERCGIYTFLPTRLEPEEIHIAVMPSDMMIEISKTTCDKVVVTYVHEE